MGFIDDQGLRYYQFDIFQDQPVFHAVLTRHGGFSQDPYATLNFGGTVGDDHLAVLKNHQRTYDILGYDFNSRFDAWQVHGTNIVCANSPRNPNSPHVKADGILTNNPNLTLFMRFADCVPILLLDPIKKVIGIVHAGWQGTYQMICQAAVEKMTTCYGSKPDTLLAAIGPSICQNCYEVGTDVLDAFIGAFGDRAQPYFSTRNGSLFLDLWKANREILNLAGVNHVETAEICTACHNSDWYSHRGENGKTGRFGVLMSIKDN